MDESEESHPVRSCFGCWQPLDEVDGTACPVCGAAYSPTDPASYYSARITPFTWIDRHIPVVVLLTAPFVVASGEPLAAGVPAAVGLLMVAARAPYGHLRGRRAKEAVWTIGINVALVVALCLVLGGVTLAVGRG